MKKLLSMLAVSTLVGTSASNLKPVFMINVVNHGFKSNQLNNKDISITNENYTNPFTPKKVTSGIPNNVEIRSLLNTSNWGVYAGTSQGLYKSVDGINFTEINETNKEDISSIAITTDRTIYISIYKGLYTINPINLLLNINKPDTFDKSWPLYNDFTKKNEN